MKQTIDYLDAKDLHAICAALRVAAEQYARDAETVPHFADDFKAQRKRALDLADRIERTEGI